MRTIFSKVTTVASIALAVTFTSSCSSGDDTTDGGSSSSVEGSSSSVEIVSIGDISFENYPRIDVSTSTEPLATIIAANLLGLEYEWKEGGQGMVPGFKPNQGVPSGFVWAFAAQTNGAIINLIDSETDIIIVARKMSPDEKQHADSVGVSLTETAIALDALDFIINEQNPIASLTVEQIQNIYLGNITNWNEVGGTDTIIKPFIRNANSGSQEMMNEVVMNREDMTGWEESGYDELMIPAMMPVFLETRAISNAICFTPHYYKDYMISDGMKKDYIKTLAVNGIAPSATTIENGTYPFIAEVYVSIRSDLDHNTMAYKLYEWLQTEEGKAVIIESGYVAN